MNPTRILAFSCASLCLAAGSLHAQLTLNGIGGSTVMSGDYGLLPTTTAFAKDTISGGTLPPHQIVHLNDGLFGNANSWIGDSANSFAGLSFGATPLLLSQVAWGRSNDFADRAAGLYTLQYTTVANPNASTLDASWTTLGTVNYEFTPVLTSPVSTGLRHLWNFNSVMATGIRLIGSTNGICIDELEASGLLTPQKLTLTTTGGTLRGGDVALSSAGSVAFAKDLYISAPAHTIDHLNDGIYGNANSWLGQTESSFAGVRFATPQTINSLAFGRDNLNGFLDRDSGNFLIQYTTVSNPDATTADANWSELGTVFYDPSDPNANLRHEYSFSPVSGVTGVRIIAPGAGGANGRAVDELEVYAVPEPGTVVSLLGGLGLLLARRRRRWS